MRKLLNTLYVTTPESYLSRDGENVVIRVEDSEKFRIPIHNLEGIVCFGYMGASPALIGLCAERNVGVSFLTEHGRFWGRVSGPVRGNVLLRRKQYRLADDKVTMLEISRIIVAGKIANCRNVLQRAMRDHGSEDITPSLKEASDLLEIRQKQALKSKEIDLLRGIEGDAANAYFSVFNNLIISQKDDFVFNGRSRRPPKDKVNALLSFVYTLLAHEVQSALESVGLDPYVGFLHTDRPGRASLALDLMEEFRPYLGDRLVLSVINRRQIDRRGFKEREESGVIMDDDTRKELIAAWHRRKQEEIKHPFLQETVQVGLLPYIQALLFARYIRGDIDSYPVFVMKQEMMVLVTYDVETVTPKGRKRLRLVAKQCVNFGQRVQNSVFECVVDPAQFAELKNRLENIVDKGKDSLRFYYLGNNWERKVEHVGIKDSYNPEDDTLII